MLLELSRCTIRLPRLEDASSIARHANNRNVWRNLRDLLPHPYCEHDATTFIKTVLSQVRPTSFVIEVDGAAVGVIGVRLRDDIERINAELGYWLGEEFWGRGILSEAIPAFTDWAMKEFNLLRVEAMVFYWNPASARVLEKSGFVREATLRRSAIKDGEVIDRWLYAFLREDG
jgi:RimJ/RimL family protein N-acetyltransferase